MTPFHSNEEMIAALYWSVKRETTEGSLAEAIRHHAQACGIVAYTCNIHPDDVARAVASQRAA